MTNKRAGAAKPSERLAASKTPKRHAKAAKAEAFARAKGDESLVSQIAGNTASFAKSRVDPLASVVTTLHASGGGHSASVTMVQRPTPMRVISKFLVTDNAPVAVVVDRALQTRYQVRLEAVYEPKSILNGMATVQGNQDNRIFGDDEPEAVIAMVIHSKAIADTLRIGRAFNMILDEIIPGS